MKGDEVKCHLLDILNEIKQGTPELKQIEHNVFEIAEHLGVEFK